jgi:hypothetical protein
MGDVFPRRHPLPGSGSRRRIFPGPSRPQSPAAQTGFRSRRNLPTDNVRMLERGAVAPTPFRTNRRTVYVDRRRQTGISADVGKRKNGADSTRHRQPGTNVIKLSTVVVRNEL